MAAFCVGMTLPAEHTRSPLAAVRRFLADEAYRRLSDDALWARFRDHADGHALQLFLEKVGGRLAARCRAITGDAALADDALQEALVQLVRHHRRIGTHNRAVAWLYRVTDSRSRMLLRTRRRAGRRDARAARPEAVEDRPPTDFEAVAAAVAELPTRERRAVELVYLEGMTHDEAAAALGLGRGSVGTYVSRGVKRLRDKLGPAGLAGALAVGGLAPERAAALAMTALARGTAVRWLPAKLAAVAGVGLLVGGAGWVANREPAQPAMTAATPAAAPETLPARTLRLFHARVLPRQLAAFAGQAVNGGEVRLASASAYDSRVECWYEFAHRHADGRPFFTTRLLLRHQSATSDTQTLMDRFGTGQFRPVDPDRFLILWTDDPVTKKEITAASGPLKAAIAAFAELPRDAAAAEAAAQATARLVAVCQPLAGDWRADGRPAARWTFRWGQLREHFGLIVTDDKRLESAFDHRWMRVGEDGRVHGLEPVYGPLAVAPDRLAFAGRTPLTRVLNDSP